jgi:Spy/CpxP family protein refolding chaperone
MTMANSILISRSVTPWRLAAAALVLAVAGGAAQMAQAMPGGPGHHGGHHGGGMMLHGRVLQSVGATSDQQTRIHDIMKAARDDVRKLHDGAGDLRTQGAQLLAAPTIDARAVEALRVKRLALHDAVSKRMTQAMLDAAAVLTPEQRAKLAEQMSKRRDLMERHRRERDSLDGAPRR